MKNQQRPLNSSYIGTRAVAPQHQGSLDQNSPLHPRAGAPKNIGTDHALAPGMRARDATGHALAFDGAKRPLDDEPLQKTYEGKEVQPHPWQTPSKTQAERGQHVPGQASAELNEAANLGRTKVINDPANGRTLDGGSSPVTTRN